MKYSKGPRYSKISASNSDFRLPHWLEILFIGIILLELLAPFVTRTLGLDGRLQLNMIVEYNKLVSFGVFIPTWTPSAFYHFGATTFYFYPPCLFYIAAVFNVLGVGNPMALFLSISLLITITSFFSARWLLHHLGSSGYLLNLAATLYAFAPLRIAELYTRSSIATHITYVFLPLICWALIAIVRDEGAASRRILILGVACALTALTDVPIAVMVAISVVIVAIFICKLLNWRAVSEVFTAMVLATSLAAYHFCAVWSAQSFSRLRDLYFPHRPEDIQLYFHLGPGTYHILLLYGVVGVIAFSYILIGWKKEPISKTEAMIGRVGLPIAAFIFFLDLFPISFIVWNHFPPLNLVQFPWRFYPLILLLGTLIVGLSQSSILKTTAKGVTAIWVIGAILPIALVIFSIHIFHPFERPLEDATEYLPIYFNPPLNGRYNGIRDAVDGEIGPHASDPAVTANLSFGESIQRTTGEPYFEQFNILLQKPIAVTFHRFYWPYWHLYAGMSEIPTRPDSIGRAVAMLPAGNYTATWRLERTPLEVAGLWISGISWAGVLLFFGIGLVRRRVKVHRPLSP